MKRLIIIICFSFTVLSACGGGGGGGGGSSDGGTTLIYQGKTTPATVTASSAQQFFLFFMSGVGEGAPTGGTIQGGVVKLTARQSFLTAKRSLKTVASIPVSGDIPGASGMAYYSGTIEANGTGVITFTYVAYDSGDGYIFNGLMTVTVNAYDAATDTVTDGVIQFKGLTVTVSQQSYTMAGSAHFNYNIGSMTESITMNIDGRMSSNNEYFKFENLVDTSVYNNQYAPTTCTETVSGRIYLGSQGYVDISQVAPLHYDYFNRFNVDVPNAGGPLILSGASSGRARVIPLSISQFKIDVDSTGDGVYEESASYLWTEQIGIVFTFNAVFGSASIYETALAAVPTSDGGCVAAGYINTNGIDFYLLRTDAAGGLLWSKSYGGTDQDQAYSVQETADQGFIIGGTTTVNGIPSDLQYGKGYIVKTDSAGNVIWERRLSARPDNAITAVRQTADGGYIFTGSINSAIQGGPVTGYGLEDLYLVKLDSQGNVLWEKRFGDSGSDRGLSVRETSSGNFIVAGSSLPLDASTVQAYLVMTDSNGNLLWQKQYGDMYSQVVAGLQPTVDDGLVALVIWGTANGYQYRLERYTKDGALLWEKTFASTDFSGGGAGSLVALPAGEYAVLGRTTSLDYTLYKVSSTGDLLSSHHIPTGSYDSLASMSLTADGGFLFGGMRDVIDLVQASSDRQALLLKTNAEGKVN